MSSGRRLALSGRGRSTGLHYPRPSSAKSIPTGGVPSPLSCAFRALLVASGVLALERLAEDANGGLVPTFTKPWADGTTGVKLSPAELLEKLVDRQGDVDGYLLSPLPEGEGGKTAAD